jgi:hypothetical protein
MNKVVHVNKADFDIYMGRPVMWSRQGTRVDKLSPWHNPFKVGLSYTREQALVEFIIYFYAPEQKALRDRALAEIKPSDVLGCWCAPLACHSDIVAGYLAWKRGE